MTENTEIDFLSEVLESESKSRTKSEEPNKYILFDETTVKIGDTEYKLRTSGIQTIEKIFNTTDKKKLAKIFIALSLKYQAEESAKKANKGKQ